LKVQNEDRRVIVPGVSCVGSGAAATAANARIEHWQGKEIKWALVWSVSVADAPYDAC